MSTVIPFRALPNGATQDLRPEVLTPQCAVPEPSDEDGRRVGLVSEDKNLVYYFANPRGQQNVNNNFQILSGNGIMYCTFFGVDREYREHAEGREGSLGH